MSAGVSQYQSSVHTVRCEQALYAATECGTETGWPWCGVKQRTMIVHLQESAGVSISPQEMSGTNERRCAEQPELPRLYIRFPVQHAVVDGGYQGFVREHPLKQY